MLCKEKQVFQAFTHFVKLNSEQFAGLGNRRAEWSRPTINQLFMKLRIGIAQVCNASSPLSGEVEVEESYFGARRVRGKRVAERAVNRSSSESWNATGNLHGNRPYQWH